MSNEIAGTGNSYTAEFWQYDPRVGRRWNLDPRPATGISEYSAFAGNPILLSDPFGDSVGPGPRIPMIARIPSGGSIKAGIGNLLYNSLGVAANSVTGALNKTADYASTIYQDGLPGLMNKVDEAYRSVTDFVGSQYDYFTNTSGAQIKADTKQFFSDPDNYFQAIEQTAVIGSAWKLSISLDQPALRRSNAAEFEEVSYNNGWRTSDGKFASPRGQAPLPGSVAEKSVWDAIAQKPGWTVQRGHVAVRNAAGNLRYYDGVAFGPSNIGIGLEIKSRTATRSKLQRAFDSNLNSSRFNTATGVGQSSGVTVNRALLIEVK